MAWMLCKGEQMGFDPWVWREKKNITKAILIAAFVLSTAILAGCTAVLHDVSVSRLPTYAETSSAWPKLAPGHGRVVIFLPRLPMAGLNPLPVGASGAAYVQVSIDDKYQTAIVDQSFVFIDLPATTHKASYRRVGEGLIGLARGSFTTSFSLAPGEIKYVKVVSDQIDSSPPEVVNRAQAEVLMKDIRHAFSEPIPFDKQDQSCCRIL